MSRHFYYAEMLLNESQPCSCNKTACKAGERYHPSFQHKNLADKPGFCPHAFKNLDVFLLFNDKHGQASEYIECNYNDDEYKDEVCNHLFILHHLI